MKDASFNILILLILSNFTLLPCLGQSTETALDRYIEESLSARRQSGPSPGSLYLDQSFLAEVARDPRAAMVGDLVTVRVVEQASALSSGTTTSSRSSENTSAVNRFLGAMQPFRPLPNLLDSSTETEFEGRGSTSRQTSVSASITSHVTHVMPNGNLVIEGAKEILVNSERQVVWLRGVVRPADLLPDNSVGSDRIGMLDLRVNGRGVVHSAIRRPNIIYRIFKSLLPF